jgi:hypothetical protein
MKLRRTDQQHRREHAKDEKTAHVKMITSGEPACNAYR